MATSKQMQAAKRNVKKAQKAAGAQKTTAHMPSRTRTALGKQGAAVAQRKRTGGTTPKTRAELYEIAKKRDLPGRSKMGREELPRKRGEKYPGRSVAEPGPRTAGSRSPVSRFLSRVDELASRPLTVL